MMSSKIFNDAQKRSMMLLEDNAVYKKERLNMVPF